MNTTASERALLQVRGLSVSFETAFGRVRAAEDVSFDLHEGETLALVGETGCGKSVVASAIMKLLPGNASVQGRAVFAGKDLFTLSEKEISLIRGRKIAMVYQNPSLALNPVIRVGEQIAEPLQVHRAVPPHRSMQMAEELLDRLGLGSGRVSRMFPFQLSGGMNQRVMIAASMILSPRIIIADEPSKGLDSTLAGEVMAELLKLKDQTGSALLLITHDLRMAASVSNRIAVMYCGEIVETGLSREVFSLPLHPYTAALLSCLPERGFQPIGGSSPSMVDPPKGCRFHPRCPRRQEGCRKRPGMVETENTGAGKGRGVRCWLY